MERKDALCHAAARQLSFAPNGDVFVCCVAQGRLGNVGSVSLRELWFGSQRRSWASALLGGEFPRGCAPCSASISAEGRAGSFPEQFDYLADATRDEAWPSRFDFMLSNACNLQCVQCSGDLSSAIRAHREHRPPIPRSYGDDFFAQIVEFLPRLSFASFEGGEPFMASENFRMWELISEHAPHVRCTVCTNGTRWSDRVVRAVESVDMDIIVSVDGASAATFEAIRVGANFDSVMANIERFQALTNRLGRRMSINHCLMTHNVHEFPDFLLWAESLGLPVQISVVREPRSSSLAGLDPPSIRQVVAELEARAEQMAHDLLINRVVWDVELARLRTWADRAVDANEPVAVALNQTILGLPVRGAGRYDDRAARAWVQGGDPAGAGATLAGVANVEIGELLVDRSQRIVSANHAAAASFGVAGGDLVGMPVLALQPHFSGYSAIEATEDEVRSELLIRGRLHRSVVVADRDDRGVVERVRILLVAIGA